jgi:hypothetical protein
MAQQSHLFVSQRPPSHSSGPCAVHEPHVTPHHTHRCACSALPRAHRSILLLLRIPAPPLSLWHSPAPAHARDKPIGAPAPRCSAGFTGSGVAQWARVPASKSAHGGERQTTPVAHVTEQDTPRRGHVKRCTMTPMWLCVDVHLIGSQVVLTTDVITSILTRPRAHSRTPPSTWGDAVLGMCRERSAAGHCPRAWLQAGSSAAGPEEVINRSRRA